MIISDKKKFIFTHIHKTGGSTIERSLKSYFDHEEVLYERAKKLNKQEYFNHIKPVLKIKQCLKQHQFLEIDPLYDVLFREYFVFTLVRNPYDLMYSRFLQNLYPKRKREKSNRYNWKQKIKKIIMGRRIEDFNHNFLLSGARLQYDYIIPEYTDFIGHTENISNDFQKICAILNLGEVDLKIKNVRTDPKPPCDPYKMKWDDFKYIDKYNRQSIKLVNQRYAKDFEYFGYQKLDPKEFPRKIEKVKSPV